MELQEKTNSTVKELTKKVKELEEKVDTKIDSFNNDMKNTIKEVVTRNDKSEYIIEGLVDNGWNRAHKMMSELNAKVDTLENTIKRIQEKVSVEINKDSKKPETKETEIIEVKGKKGVIFTSSVASKMDMDMFEKATDSKVEVIKTYRIHKNYDVKVKDPKLHLKNMVNEHMTKDSDFAVLSVGSNDIADLDLEQPKEFLVDSVLKQSKELVDIAVKMAEENQSNVFINERIPRHDEPHSELKAELTYVANSIMISQVAVAKSSRVHLVKQSNLYRAPGEARDQLYTQRSGQARLSLLMAESRWL